MMRSIYQEQQCAQSTDIGGGWFQEKVCRYPDHTGKAKPDRTIKKLQSKIIFDELKNLVPVGSGKITLFVQM